MQFREFWELYRKLIRSYFWKIVNVPNPLILIKELLLGQTERHATQAFRNQLRHLLFWVIRISKGKEPIVSTPSSQLPVGLSYQNLETLAGVLVISSSIQFWTFQFHGFTCFKIEKFAVIKNDFQALLWTVLECLSKEKKERFFLRTHNRVVVTWRNSLSFKYVWILKPLGLFFD